ncbi:MAG: hypothetical protein QXG03_06935 [Halalkalicoccus sp.]
MDDGPGPVYGGDPQRTGGALADQESAYDVFVDFIQGGLAQVAFCSAPALWVVATVPTYTTEVATAAMVAILWLSLSLTALRGGHLSVGRPWPALTNRRFGTTGWRAFLTRGAYLSATLLLVVSTGVLAQLIAGTYLANVAVALVGSTVALWLLPVLSTAEPRVRLARFVYCLLGVCIAGFGVFALAPDPGALVALAVILGLAMLDARPAGALRALGDR